MNEYTANTLHVYRLLMDRSLVFQQLQISSDATYSQVLYRPSVYGTYVILRINYLHIPTFTKLLQNYE